MAVSTINPWSAGAVTFNMQPWEAFYERQAARKQAKEDALDNYFRDLGKNVTSAGMRSQDVPTLLGKNKEWQQFYSQNKSAILNPKLDNGAAYSEYMNRYQDQLGTINQSKEAMKSMDAIGKMKLNPQMSYVFDDPHLVQQIQSHELPISDPNRQGINLATLTLPQQPVTTKDLDAYNKYLTGNVPFDKIPGQTENLPGFKTRTPIRQQYSPENQMVIGDHAANAYDTDKRWRLEAKKYFNELSANPEEYKRANTLFKSLYGSDIDDPKEAWMAKGILDNNMRATEYKEGKDDFGLAMFMEKLKHANAKDLIRYKKEIDPDDKDMNNVWYQTYLDKVMNTAKQSGELRHMYQSDGKSLGYFNMIDPDPFLMKAFSRRNTEPDKLGVTQDGKIMPIFYKYTKGGVVKDKSGNPVIDQDDSRPMSYDQALVNIGYRGRTKKQLGEDLGKGSPSGKSTGQYPLPAGKPRTVKQGGYTYTWNEVTGQYE
jgi:hypothetical protein